MVMMILGPVALMPNALSALKVMKKFNQKLEDRKLIDRNIIKDRQPFLININLVRLILSLHLIQSWQLNIMHRCTNYHSKVSDQVTYFLVKKIQYQDILH